MPDIRLTPFKRRDLRIDNRFVMAAAVDGLTNDTETRMERYKTLAEGGVGLIIAGRVLDKNEAFDRVVDAVHEAGGRIALHLV